MVRNRPPSDLARAARPTSPSKTRSSSSACCRARTPRRRSNTSSHDAQEALLKAMAQEDVAALLNDMAPDDRTMFLEELPASVTRQLLALLTPEERAVAVTLLGYPEGSIGRLMTPRLRRACAKTGPSSEVLDYVRDARAGQRNAQRHLRRRRARAADRRHPHPRVPADLARQAASRDLMDRRFVALKATDDQETAVAVFRAVRPHRRCRSPTRPACSSASSRSTTCSTWPRRRRPRTSSASADRRRSTSRTWRSRFWRMIQKRAGWLTALFLGEMLTATAMGVFEARDRSRPWSWRCSCR